MVGLLARLKRHPFPVEAWFERVVAVSYALPSERSRALVPEPLVVDEHEGSGFVTVALCGMGVLCALDPQVHLERSRAGAWCAWSACAFWAARWWCQHFVYPSSAWRGRRLETALHLWFTLVWSWLILLFGVCGARQVGWID